MLSPALFRADMMSTSVGLTAEATVCGGDRPDSFRVCSACLRVSLSNVETEETRVRVDITKNKASTGCLGKKRSWVMASSHESSPLYIRSAMKLRTKTEDRKYVGLSAES